MQKWEYNVGFDLTQQGLVEVGEGGWELVAVTERPGIATTVYPGGKTFYFKRPVDEGKSFEAVTLCLEGLWPEDPGYEEAYRRWQSRQTAIRIEKKSIP